ncbi:MAG: HAD family hydrolase [Promethearchaeota archaeon]
MIQAITFDLWNTLFVNKFYRELRINWFIQFLKDYSIHFSKLEIEKAFESAFNLPIRNFKDTNHIYTEDRIIKLLKILQIDLSEKDIMKVKNIFEDIMLKDPPPLKKGVKQILDELSTNYKIGLISNTGITPGRIIIKVFQEYNILQYFQVMVFSDEIGYYKPHPILFNTALKELACNPRNAIHIGDRLETDIKGAKDCNMYAIWFNESNNNKSQLIQPDYEIQEIFEVISIVKKII